MSADATVGTTTSTSPSPSPNGTHAGAAPASAAAAAEEAPAPTRSPWQTTLHEGFTVALAGTILILTVWMMVRTFESGAEPYSTDDKQAALKKDAYERQKDLMMYGLALLGTVTGYYLGRVPAERRADSAQQSADKAQRTASDARYEAAGATAKAARAEEDKAAMKSAAREAGREARAAVEAAAEARGGAAEPKRALRGGEPPEAGAAPAPAPDMRSAQAALQRLDKMLDRMG